ncbi:MAG: YggS family pyridoxal phosphate-dependent enzyme [Alphaproteobacteria bacterium]|nr:YggS family pyridoxal phosphate-dependent enzyme [Alphaproteobacteria bacterium]
MSFKENIAYITSRIAKVAKHWGMDKPDTNIIAVAKKQSVSKIKESLECGHRLYGENRVQDAYKVWNAKDGFKRDFKDIELHLIGPLQSNKTKEAVALFDCIQTLDREKLADALKAEIEKQGRQVKIFVQVNTGEEDQKAGVLPRDLDKLLAHCRDIGLEVRGLMCIPPVDEPASLHFSLLKELANRYGLQETSMGMSGDFEKAVPLNPTYLRIGTALFGERLN